MSATKIRPNGVTGDRYGYGPEPTELALTIMRLARPMQRWGGLPSPDDGSRGRRLCQGIIDPATPSGISVSQAWRVLSAVETSAKLTLAGSLLVRIPQCILSKKACQLTVSPAISLLVSTTTTDWRKSTDRAWTMSLHCPEVRRTLHLHSPTNE